MASTTASIPRFLLPQSGRIWRRAGSSSAPRRLFLRLSSSSSSSSISGSGVKPPASGPRVLAKPERFNPPSHGSRLPKKIPPRQYGGDLTADEATAQAARDYPGLPPPPQTRAHWFLHSRWIHVVITVGTLSTLAIYTFAINFQATSPFADLLPPASDYLYHPIGSARMLIEVLRLHEAHKTARISEKRKRNVEDVAKRAAYRKAHGLPDEMGLFNQPMAKVRTEYGDRAEQGEEAGRVASAAAAAAGEGEGVREQQAEGGEGAVVVEVQSKEPEVRRLTDEERRAVVEKAKGKWLGIF
ncbi:hypothetical protein N657DRAFT_664564 [Parathielavia appendiculata]|uniref:Uncharacterized protein n=1 Tax=Parathielavia appendiculata TaxID=2587402 RepID=A0AAN6TYW1_9PEZI|nr:hypothetical protein N657DRAFT_664564 [Parathielavia appendiculata]